MFDWSSVDEQFDMFLEKQQEALPVQRKKVKLADAKQAIWEFYSAHKATLPSSIIADRDKLQDLVMAGHPVADAFEEILASRR